MALIFDVRDAEEGAYCARALGHAIFTEANTWEDLRANVLEATSLHFEDESVRPRLVQLHYVKDELIPLEDVTLSRRPADWSAYLASGPVASEKFMDEVEDLPV